MERILVRFEGEGSGVGELSWGQQDIWDAIRRLRSSLGVGGVVPLRSGATVEDVAGMLGFLTGRHQSLRTRLRFDSDGHPRQVVSSAGEIPLEIFDVDDGEDPVRFGEALWTRYHDTEFDYAGEWPIRMAALRQRGVPTHMVCLVCHLATDGFGADVLRADLSNVDEWPVPPVTATPPLEQARWQRSSAGRRYSDATLRYWEGLLRTISARRFPEPKTKPEPRYREVVFTSPATHLAALKIAERTGAGSSSVLFAAFAVALRRVTAINPVVAQIVVSNRFRPGLAEAVSPLCHAGLSVMDVDGVDFDRVVDRAWRALMRACKNAYYDPEGMLELVGRISADRGTWIDRDCFFNDRRARHRQEASGSIPAHEIASARPLTTLDWVPPYDEVCERFFLHINDVPDTLDIRLSVDTHHVAPDVVEAFLHEMEEAVVSAAVNPARV